MKSETTVLTSFQNPRVKTVVKLRNRSHRDEEGLLLIEGYRELRRALDNRWNPLELYYCPALYQGKNEGPLVERCRAAGAQLFECSEAVFRKMAYRDQPEGLLALAPQIQRTLQDIHLPENPLLLVAESIEKPGNLGTMLRTADAAGVHAVIVCDRGTDINNPNVVRSSIGTLFAVPVCDASSDEAVAWLKERQIHVIAASPHAWQEYTEMDYTRATAFVMGTEQYGLSEKWMKGADKAVRIPMLGQCDSLNVAAATTILLYEAVRQRRKNRP